MRWLLVLLFSIAAFAQTTCINCGGGGGSGGSGSVSSVGLSMPTTFCSVTNSPVTAADTLTCSYATGQTGNLIFGTDGSGNVGLMNLTAAQLPNPGASSLGGIRSFATVSHQFLTGISTSGVPSTAQPSFADVSGIIAATQLPNPSATTLGGVESLAASTNLFLTSISTLGVPVAAQPTFANLSGSAASTQMPAFSGDCSTSAGATALNCTKTAGALFATSATTDTTNASNIASGTLPAGRLPNPSASTLGGVQSAASVSHQWINSISTSGIPALSQPASSDISGIGSAATQNANTFSLQGGYFSNTYTVGTGGVTAGHLVQFDASANVVAATTSYGGIAATTQTVGQNVEVIRHAGIASCVFENTAVIGHIVIPGTSDHTECRDSGVTTSASVLNTTQIIGVASSAGSGSQSLRIHPIGSVGTSIAIAQLPTSVVATAAIFSGICSGTVTSNATIVLYPFQAVTTACTSTTAVKGPPVGVHTFNNLHVFVATASGTAGSGVVTVYQNGTATALTCTLGTLTTCEDLTHSFTTSDGDQITLKIQSTAVSGDTLATPYVTFEAH